MGKLDAIVVFVILGLAVVALRACSPGHCNVEWQGACMDDLMD